VGITTFASDHIAVEDVLVDLSAGRSMKSQYFADLLGVSSFCHTNKGEQFIETTAVQSPSANSVVPIPEAHPKPILAGPLGAAEPDKILDSGVAVLPPQI
jgi:hypothetical protein